MSTPSLWTAILPAGGRGTRLGSELPKALFPVGGRPLLQWTIDKVTPLVGRIALVIAPSQRPLFEALVAQQPHPERFVLVEQREPLGTVDALLAAEGATNTRQVLVVWGDHFGVKGSTIARSMQAHETRRDTSLTLPTCRRPQPYIAIQRDTAGKITSVLQARELQSPLSHGENDCGTFCFRSGDLFPVLRRAIRSPEGRGEVTRELNLLSLLPEFETLGAGVQTLADATFAETLGINTREEAARAETTLSEVNDATR